MTIILLAAWLFTLAALFCALVGASQQADHLKAQIAYRDARIEDLEDELRHRSRANHPAGRALRAVSETPIYEDLAVADLRAALEARDAGTEPEA